MVFLKRVTIELQLMSITIKHSSKLLMKNTSLMLKELVIITKHTLHKLLMDSNIQCGLVSGLLLPMSVLFAHWLGGFNDANTHA
jgi:hypothetical protein